MRRTQLLEFSGVSSSSVSSLFSDSPPIFLQMHYKMNGDSEAEMMDTDSSKTFVIDKPTAARDDFLSAARRLVDQCQPSQALQAVVMAMRTQGGDQAVLQILNRTRELYKRRIQETASIDQLASIFAECAITEAQPLGHEPTSADLFGTREELQRMLVAFLFWKKVGVWCRLICRRKQLYLFAMRWSGEYP